MALMHSIFGDDRAVAIEILLIMFSATDMYFLTRDMG